MSFRKKVKYNSTNEAGSYTPDGLMPDTPASDSKNSVITVSPKQLTLTQMIPTSDEKNNNSDDDKEDEYDPILKELELLKGEKYIIYEDTDKPIIVGIPHFKLWTGWVCLNQIQETKHATVVNSTARAMVLEKNCGDYIAHHTDKEFVKENHHYVKGMIYLWFVLALPLLDQIQADAPCQLTWTEKIVPVIIHAVERHSSTSIGTLNMSYVRKHIYGLERYEDAVFASYMATCTRFELYTKFEPSVDGCSKWVLYTKIYREEDETGRNISKPLWYAFGRNFKEM